MVAVALSMIVLRLGGWLLDVVGAMATVVARAMTVDVKRSGRTWGRAW